MIEKVILLENVTLIDFLGVQNSTIKKLSIAFPLAKIISRSDEIKIQGDKKDVAQLSEVISLLLEHYKRYGALRSDDVDRYLMNEDQRIIAQTPQGNQEDIVLFGNKGIVIKPKTPNQKAIVDAIVQKDLVFAIGPAGTGKTYMAVAMAVQALKSKKIKKIIITRPAVEAGESLGFLPGDLREKIDPYLRPIYDALEDMLTPEKLTLYKETQVIEIAPLAYMRGRTLSNAYVLLDEAQNTTPVQIKMFMTRLGPQSKMIITGDTSQIDLPLRQKSGLVDAIEVLRDVKEVAIIQMDNRDVVRHSIVQRVIAAYEKRDSSTEQRKNSF